MKPVTKLLEPNITKVDLVDAPANPKAKIMLFKSEDGAEHKESKIHELLSAIARKIGINREGASESKSFNDTVNTALLNNHIEKVWDYSHSLNESIKSILSDDLVNNKLQVIQGSLDQFSSAVLSHVDRWCNGEIVEKSNLSEEETAHLKSIIKSLQDIIVETPKSNIEKGVEGIVAIDKATLSQEVQDFIAGLENEVAILKKETATKSTEPDDVMKSIPDSVKKMIADKEAEVKAAHEEVKKLKDAELVKSFVAKAALYDKLSIKTEEFGLVLKSISETNPDALEKVETVLKAANEAVAKGNLFAETGTSRTKSTGDAYEAIEVMVASEIAKAEKPMSKEEAMAKVLDSAEGRKLYEDYRKEVKV